MTDLSAHFIPDPDLSAIQRGMLPDAPLAMPTQILERAGPQRWLVALTVPLRLFHLPSREV